MISPKQHGFSLLEVSIYLCIQSIMLFMVLQAIISLHKLIEQESQARSTVEQIMIVHDLLARDIKQASPHQNDWPQKDRLLFCQEFLDQNHHAQQAWIEWACVKRHGKHGIIRIQGIYDIDRQLWIKKIKHDFFMCPIDQLIINLSIEPSIKTITAINLIYCLRNKKKIDKKIALANHIMMMSQGVS